MNGTEKTMRCGAWAMLWLLAGASGAAAQRGGDTASSRDVLVEPMHRDVPVADRSVAEQEAAAREAERMREEEDDGRDADLLWLEAGVGAAFVDLVTFRQRNFYPSAERTRGFGPLGAFAAGFRVKWLTVGGRATFTALPGAFDLGTLGLDLGFRIPFGFLEPHVRIGVGYGWVGQANFDDPRLSDTSVYGLVLDGGVGLDLYFGDMVSIGASGSVAVLNLTRQDVRNCGMAGATDCNVAGVDLRDDGDSVGLQVRAQAHLALHF